MKKPQAGRNVALLCGLVAITLGVVLVVRRLDDGWFVDRSAEPLPISPDSRGKKVDILEGKIPVIEFLRFLEDYTGLAVIHDSGDTRIIEGVLVVAARISDADAEVVRALLEVNGFEIRVETLSGGRQVLNVTSTRR